MPTQPPTSPNAPAGDSLPQPRPDASAARERLARARLYVCTDTRSGPDDLRAFARAAFDGGVDIIQVRQKGIEAAHELAALAIVAEEARRAGALAAANDRADVAALAGVDVLHVGQLDLTPEQARTVAPDALLGLSTHDVDQMTAAAHHDGLDYFCTGPLWATPTKPGRPGVGLDLVRAAAESGTRTPWFAIGGIDDTNVGQVLDAGATRIVVVRAITGADDPRASARRLRSRLAD